jgi:arylsulfatase A-like enzyme
VARLPLDVPAAVALVGGLTVTALVRLHGPAPGDLGLVLPSLLTGAAAGFAIHALLRRSAWLVSRAMYAVDVLAIGISATLVALGWRLEGPASAVWLGIPLALDLGGLLPGCGPRRFALSALALLGAGAGLALLGWRAPIVLPEPRPNGPTTNVVLITVDTLRADHVGCYGYAPARTPHLDALCDRAAVFTRSFAPYPYTRPSHASMLTGLYPPHHGVLGNGIPLRRDVETLPERLARVGYETAAFVSAYPLKPHPAGLSHRFDFYEANFSTWPWLSQSARFLHVVRVFKPFSASLTATLERGQRTASETNRAVFDWLEREHSAPFFLWVHYYDPHQTYAPPERFARLHDAADATPVEWERLSAEEREALAGDPHAIRHITAMYDGEISYVDEEIGRLLQRLDESGLRERSLIVVTSDHGESLTDHGYYFDHAGVYDAVMRVPLIVALPEGEAAGRVVSANVTTVDLTPTILDVLGLEAAPGDGRSLLPLLRGAAPEAPQPVYHFVDRHPSTNQQVHVAVRRDRYKLIRRSVGWNDVQRVPPDEELYDVEADPGERHPLEEGGPVREELRALAEPWMDRFGRREEAVDEEVRRQLEALGYAP